MEKQTVNEISIVKTEKLGRYTFAEAVDSNGVRGVGVSRRGFNDAKKDDLGTTIAQGRAIESVERKRSGRHINSPFMG